MRVRSSAQTHHAWRASAHASVFGYVHCVDLSIAGRQGAGSAAVLPAGPAARRRARLLLPRQSGAHSVRAWARERAECCVPACVRLFGAAARTVVPMCLWFASTGRAPALSCFTTPLFVTRMPTSESRAANHALLVRVCARACVFARARDCVCHGACVCMRAHARAREHLPFRLWLPYRADGLASRG